MISALSNQDLLHFDFHGGAINTDKFIEFLQALIQDAKRKQLFCGISLLGRPRRNYWGL